MTTQKQYCRKTPWLRRAGSALTVLIIILGSWNAAAAKDGQGPITIQIGVLLPFSGSLSEIAQTNFDGVQFAVDEINAQGGIRKFGGARLHILKGDTQGDPTIGNQELRRLAQAGVIALMGAYQSTVTYANTELAEQLRIPYLIATSLADNITERGLQFTFRPEANVSMFVRDQFQFISDTWPLRQARAPTLGIIHEDTLFGQMAAIAQRKSARRYGYRVVADIAYSATQRSFFRPIQTLVRSNPDVVLQSSYLHDAIEIARAMKHAQWRPQLIIATGAGPKDPQFIETLGADAEGWFVVNEWCPDMRRPGAALLNTRFRAAYHRDLEGITAMNYVTVWTLKEALEKMTTLDAQSLREALAEISIDSGPATIVPLGRIALDERGQGEFTALITQIIDGKHRTVWPSVLANRLPAFEGAQ